MSVNGRIIAAVTPVRLTASSNISGVPTINLTNMALLDGDSSELPYSAQSVSIYSPTEPVNAMNVFPDDPSINSDPENNFDTFFSAENNHFVRGCCVATSAASITSAALFLPGLDIVSLYATSFITSLICICESMDIAGAEDWQYRAINFLTGMLIFPCLFALGRDGANTALNSCPQ